MHRVIGHVIAVIVHVVRGKERVVMMRVHLEIGQMCHSGSDQFFDSRTVWTGTGFRSVSECQASRVNDSVIPDECDWDLSRLTHPLPAVADQGNVRDDAEQRLLTPIHGLGDDIAQPHRQFGVEIFTSQFQHRHITAAIQLQRVDHWDGSDRTGCGTQSLVKAVLRLVRGNNGPRRSVINHLLVRLFWTWSRLELDDPLLRQAEIHPLRAFHVKGNFVQLRHRIGGLQISRLLVHFANDLKS